VRSGVDDVVSVLEIDVLAGDIRMEDPTR